MTEVKTVEGEVFNERNLPSLEEELGAEVVEWVKGLNFPHRIFPRQTAQGERSALEATANIFKAIILQTAAEDGSWRPLEQEDFWFTDEHTSNSSEHDNKLALRRLCQDGYFDKIEAKDGETKYMPTLQFVDEIVREVRSFLEENPALPA
jgi:hypothetical protein